MSTIAGAGSLPDLRDFHQEQHQLAGIVRRRGGHPCRSNPEFDQRCPTGGRDLEFNLVGTSLRHVNDPDLGTLRTHMNGVWIPGMLRTCFEDDPTTGPAAWDQEWRVRPQPTVGMDSDSNLGDLLKT